MLRPAPRPCFKIGMGRRHSRRTKDRLGRNVARIRRARDLSQAELAARAKVTQALVSAIELAKANPTLESLNRLATALQVGLPDLFAD
jgi:transcriptional regulator with XRE-family HTH domain